MAEEEEERQELRLPADNEVIGVVTRLLGYDRLEVKCADGYTRIARIPGKFKKKVWFREGDIVLVAPWDFQAHSKADVVWRYSRDEVKELERRGLLKFLEQSL
ncbi:translation initiation factor eIF-1A [Candidatus Geothermarchaeota archaeon ex4572_27]|nr:MAG: translation initiation factor eIF-1A [Candidatus Geothermarchaeota archaeon ex4572_27]